MPKPYLSIPGPKGPFGLGNLYNYLPLIGRYSWKKLHLSGFDKHCQYGSIVREKMVPGTDIVWLYNPNDIALLLNERDYPQRRSHLALEKYRKDRPNIYKSSGLLPTNGEEWWRLRSELQREISSPRNVKDLFVEANQVTNDFISNLPENKSFDVLPLLARLNLELTGALIFGERFEAFSSKELEANSRTSRLIQAAEDTNSSILPTDQGLQLWRLFETGDFKKLRKAQEYMESFAIDLVNRKYKIYQKKKSESNCHFTVIEKYFENSNLSFSDIIGSASDFLLAGIDTTSYTGAFAVYHLATNSAIQDKIHSESQLLLHESENSLLLNSALFRDSIPYTRSFLKEVFRLNPISVGVGRILNKDSIFSNFSVPKGTVVVTQNMVACRLEENFDSPLQFNPDRWLIRNNQIHPYLVLPFGHGMRSCIARRLAEQNLLILILTMVSNFKIVWEGDHRMPLGIETLLINKPDKPVIIKLKSR